MILLGKHNPRVKGLLRLAHRRGREKEERFLIEGPRLVLEALSADWPLEAVYCSARFTKSRKLAGLLNRLHERRVAVFEVPPGVFDRIACTEEPQGVLAVGRIRKVQLADLLRDPKPLIVVVDGLQDPGNLGTMLRTAGAAGASGAVLLPGTVSLYNPKVVRATAGALFRLPVVEGVSVTEALAFIKNAGLKLVAAEAQGDLPFYAADFLGPTAIAVGGEGAGLKTEVKKAAHQRVFIPMPGGTESLNAAVAASLLIYEALRQRQGL
ncbi:MAG TPA: RNA methyltransferase [Desulfotomaculum sp.]|nr:RNA methyltransferase [Desulfotomaculum sp.]